MREELSWCLRWRQKGRKAPQLLRGTAPQLQAPGPAHLEEIDLYGAVAEVQDDGAARAEPCPQVGQPSQLISFPGRDVSPRLQQVFTHVIPEILEESDLVGKSGVQDCRMRA